MQVITLVAYSVCLAPEVMSMQDDVIGFGGQRYGITLLYNVTGVFYFLDKWSKIYVFETLYYKNFFTTNK